VLAEVAKLNPQLTAKHVDGLLMMLDTENNGPPLGKPLSHRLHSPPRSQKHLPVQRQTASPGEDRQRHSQRRRPGNTRKGRRPQPIIQQRYLPKPHPGPSRLGAQGHPRDIRVRHASSENHGRNSEEMSLILRKRLPKIAKKSAWQRVNKLLRSLECIHGRQPSQEKP